MHDKRITRFLSASILLISTAAIARAESPWAALLRADATALHDEVLASHPGAVDPLNPGFKDWLEAGYRQALERAGTTTTYDGYRFALLAYANGFHDGHLGVGFELRKGRVSWPGFLVGWADGTVAVRSAAGGGGASLPAVGSELIGCDGTAAEAMVRRDVFPFDGKLGLEAEWTRLTPYLFLDRGNPWRGALPQKCSFREQGEVKERTLAWRAIDVDELMPQLEKAMKWTAFDFAVRDFGAHGVWVSIPSFAEDGGNEAKLKDLVDRAASWKDRDPIVLDVRGNGGGNSAWGQQIVEKLYGHDYVVALQTPYEAKTYVEWRVSPANAAYIEQLAPRLQAEFGKDSDTGRWAQRTLDGMRQAKAEGRQLVHPAETPAPAAGPLPANPIHGRVLLLTDGSCGSACLDFCDLVRLLPNATHVGRSTFADSVYMELRRMPLPSGVATLGLPIKVYRDRPRGNNEAYTPQVRFAGDITDTAAVERWIGELAAQPALQAPKASGRR
jgi:hypothetical protein